MIFFSIKGRKYAHPSCGSYQGDCIYEGAYIGERERERERESVT